MGPASARVGSGRSVLAPRPHRPLEPLKELPGAANASIPRGLTALHAAAAHGWVEGLQALLATGAARDARVDDMLATQACLRAFPHLGTLDPFGFMYRHVCDGCTALHLAAVQGYAAVGVLLEAGLEVDAEDSRGVTPLGCVRFMAHQSTNMLQVAKALLAACASCLRPISHGNARSVLAGSTGELAAHALALMHKKLQPQRRQLQPLRRSQRCSSGEPAGTTAPAVAAGGSSAQLTDAQLQLVLHVAAQHGSPTLLRFFVRLAQEASAGHMLPADLASSLLGSAARNRRESMLVELMVTGACAQASAQAFASALHSAACSCRCSAAARGSSDAGRHQRCHQKSDGVWRSSSCQGAAVHAAHAAHAAAARITACA